MKMYRDLITIGFNKNGETDFGIRADIKDLSIAELEKLRAMIPVAIYVAEDMWRRQNIEPCGEKDTRENKLITI